MIDELNIWVLVIAIISMIISIISIIISIILHNRELKNKKEYYDSIQIDLVKGIETQLRIIGQNISGHQEELNKKPSVVPSYDIHELNADFYLTNLRHEIKCYETELLKEAIIRASNKIKNINQLLHLAQDFDSHINEDTTRNPHIAELKAESYKYHLHLERLLKIIGEAVKKILYLKHPKLIGKHFRRKG